MDRGSPVIRVIISKTLTSGLFSPKYSSTVR